MSLLPLFCILTLTGLRSVGAAGKPLSAAPCHGQGEKVEEEADLWRRGDRSERGGERETLCLIKLIANTANGNVCWSSIKGRKSSRPFITEHPGFFPLLLKCFHFLSSPCILRVFPFLLRPLFFINILNFILYFRFDSFLSLSLHVPHFLFHLHTVR